LRSRAVSFHAVFLAADLGAALLDLLVGFGFLGVHFGFQLECLVFCFQDGFFSFLVCGLDRFVHQAGSLGLGTADLSLSGFFTVVITNKITRGTCHNGDHDYDHNHCDCGHRVHSPQKIKFNETLRNRAWVFEKIQLSTEK